MQQRHIKPSSITGLHVVEETASVANGKIDEYRVTKLGNGCSIGPSGRSVLSQVGRIRR
jgi:hypothetical protein